MPSNPRIPPRRDIEIVAFADLQLLDVAGPLQVFASANDMAVLKIDGSQFPTVAFGDDHAAKIGEWVVAIGNPLGLDFTVTPRASG